MDNGPLQQEMANQFKQELKSNANMRRTLGYMREAQTLAKETQQQDRRNEQADVGVGTEIPVPIHNENTALTDRTIRRTDGARLEQSGARRVWPGCDPGFTSYYLDFFFPFLFPFYQPSMIEGGRAWLLEFMNEAEGMQQTIMALSSYLFSIVLDATEAGHEACKKIGWDKLLAEMQNTFTSLRDEIPKLSQKQADAASQLPLAVRVLGTIVHLQRFEIATLGFANCHMHLNAAVQCFGQILDNGVAASSSDVSSKFFAVMASMGPSPWPRPYKQFQIASTEQVAFRFFVSLLVADDIIASTSLAEQPRLYSYHTSLLSGQPERESPVDLAAVMGCQNWVMLRIGEISALSAWKRGQESNNSLLLEVTRRGEGIKDALLSRIEPLALPETSRPVVHTSDEEDEISSVFHVWQSHPLTPVSQIPIVTKYGLTPP